MKKYMMYTLPLWLAGNVWAAEPAVDYGVYSEEYNQCRAEEEDGSGFERCATDEYYRLQRQIEKVKIDIKASPAFASYNNTELSLVKNAENMQKYNDLYCKYMQTAADGETSLIRCKLDMANMLYVDLYKIYEAINRKQSKSAL